MIATHYSTRTNPKTTRWLALGAVVGPILFTLAWLILGFISPGYQLWDMWIAPYSAVSQPISGLGLGVTAPFMNVAFILTGVLTIAGAIGIFRSIPEIEIAKSWRYTLLLALPGLGTIIDGVFNLESFMLHNLGFLLVLSVIVGFPIVGLQLRKIPDWQRLGRWLMLGGPLTLVLAALFFATFNPEASGAGLGIAGLTQRLLIVQIHTWYVTLGWRASRML